MSRCADCGDKLKNSLFMVGETGGNDYNYALMARKTIKEIKATVSQEVVDTIINGTRVSSLRNIRASFVLVCNYSVKFCACVVSETN